MEKLILYYYDNAMDWNCLCFKYKSKEHAINDLNELIRPCKDKLKDYDEWVKENYNKSNYSYLELKYLKNNNFKYLSDIENIIFCNVKINIRINSTLEIQTLDEWFESNLRSVKYK